MPGLAPSLPFLASTGVLIVKRTLYLAAVAATLLGWGSQGLAQPSDGGKPLIVAAFSGYDALMKDVAWVDNLAGKPGLPAMLRGGIAQFTGGKGLAGIDTKRPWGMIVSAGVGQFPVLAFVPVKDFKQLLEALKPFIGDVEETDGVYEIPMGAQTVFAKEAKGWVFLSRAKDALKSVPADPVKQLGGLPEQYTVSVRVLVRNVPEELKQMVLPMIQMGMQAGLEQMPGESDAQFAIRKKMAETSIQQITQLANELDTFTLGLGVDHQTDSLRLEYAIVAKPGTELAKQISATTDGKTRFGGFFAKDAALGMIGLGGTSEVQATQVQSLIAGLRSNVEQEIDRQEMSEADKKKAKELLGELLDVFQPFFKATKTDAGMMVKADSQGVALAAGIMPVDGPKLAAFLKKLADQLAKDAPDVAKHVKLDADQRDGVHFHTFSLPIDQLGLEGTERENFEKLFGKSLDVVVGTGQEAVYLAAGRNALDLLKAAMDQSKQLAGQTVPPMQMFLAGAPIARLVQTFADEEEARQIAGRALKILEAAGGKDRLLMTATVIANGMKVRIEAQPGLVSLLQLADIPKAPFEEPAEEKPPAEAEKPAGKKPAKTKAKAKVLIDQ